MEFVHRWAIDVQKVQSIAKYADSVRFVAADPTTLLPPELAAGAGAPEMIIQAGSAPTAGRPMLWGNMQTLNFDHTAHVDDPAGNPIVNIIDAGQELDPPGYLNILALKNASRHEQDEIREYLRNGDILVYFHPEDDDVTQFRMHHAAMYYDTGQGPLAISLNGVPYVHHIDNPTSYGPAFNAGPSSTPFHVYRFNPNGAANVGGRNGDGQFVFPCTEAIRTAGGPEACQAGAESFTITDEMAAQYGYMARNWALITNEHAPFSNFHNMTWNDVDQREATGQTIQQMVDAFAGPALSRGDTPEVYCAGLVFTNLNLAMNRPLNQAAMGDAFWTTFMGNEYQFNDRYMEEVISAEQLMDPTDLPRLGRLLIEPIPASEILDNWLVGYFGRLPRQARAAILGGAADKIAAGFRSLVWADTKDAGAAEENPVVATPERIQLYAQAYASGDADQLTISAATGTLTVVPGPDGQPDLPQMKALELQYVDNRYVPPPQFHSLAQQPDSLLSYVATVIHVDLLSPIGDNTGDTGSGIVDEFAQGGPDSSLYEHFLVANGSRHVQRIFDVSSGPTQIGLGSKVSTRVSASDINDVRVILHPAGTFGPLASLYACDRDAACIGDAAGIPVPVTAAMNGGNAVFDDVDVSFLLFAPVAEGGPRLHHRAGRRTHLPRLRLGHRRAFSGGSLEHRPRLRTVDGVRRRPRRSHRGRDRGQLRGVRSGRRPLEPVVPAASRRRSRGRGAPARGRRRAHGSDLLGDGAARSHSGRGRRSADVRQRREHARRS